MFRQHYEMMYNLARCILGDDDESKVTVFNHLSKALDWLIKKVKQ